MAAVLAFAIISLRPWRSDFLPLGWDDLAIIATFVVAARVLLLIAQMSQSRGRPSVDQSSDRRTIGQILLDHDLKPDGPGDAEWRHRRPVLFFIYWVVLCYPVGFVLFAPLGWRAAMVCSSVLVLATTVAGLGGGHL